VSEHRLSVTHHAVASEEARPQGAPPATPSLGEIQPRFYYDLSSPESYLAAERVMADLPVVPEWTPILAADLPDAAAEGDRDAGDLAEPAARRAAVEARARDLHVQPLRWPAEWSRTDARVAMIAATFAKQMGRGVAFSLAAFRQAFAGGRDLADEHTALIAGAACEMHPKALLRALGRASLGRALDEATAAAAAAGVRSVPAIQIGAEVFHGERGIDQAAAALDAALVTSSPAPASAPAP
jgi:2-hydroxychromene-2-carboxylate isomerase